MEQQQNVLKHFKKTLDDLVLRELVKESVKDYKDNDIYIIYGDGSVFPFSEEIIDINKKFESRKKYIISKPVKL